MTVEYKHEVIIEWSKELTLILCVCEVGTDALHFAVTRTNYQAETGCTKLIASRLPFSGLTCSHDKTKPPKRGRATCFVWHNRK